MGASLTYKNSYDLCAAGRTFLILTVIYSKVVLKFTAAVDPVEGRSVAAYAFIQYGVDRLMQCLSLLRRDRIGNSQRMKLCDVQRLVGVDIAHAGQKGLVEQQRLDLAVLPVQGIVKPLCCKVCV